MKLEDKNDVFKCELNPFITPVLKCTLERSRTPTIVNLCTMKVLAACAIDMRSLP